MIGFETNTRNTLDLVLGIEQFWKHDMKSKKICHKLPYFVKIATNSTLIFKRTVKIANLYIYLLTDD